MDLEKLLKLSNEYLIDFVGAFVETLQKPGLYFQPVRAIKISRESLDAHVDGSITKLSVNPKLLIFVLISIFLGSTLSALLPGRTPPPELTAIIVYLISYWFFFGFATYLICKIAGGSGSFLETLSVCLQLFSVVYVISSFFGLIWGILLQATWLNAILSGVGNSALQYLNSPISGYLLIQFILLFIYLPLSIRQIHNFGRRRQGLIRTVIIVITLISISILVIGGFSGLNILNCESGICGGG